MKVRLKSCRTGTLYYCNNLLIGSVLIVKDSHILDQTWKAFNTKLGPHWKDQENSYQVRQALTLSCKLVAPILV